MALASDRRWCWWWRRDGQALRGLTSVLELDTRWLQQFCTIVLPYCTNGGSCCCCCRCCWCCCVSGEGKMIVRLSVRPSVRPSVRSVSSTSEVCPREKQSSRVTCCLPLTARRDRRFREERGGCVLSRSDGRCALRGRRRKSSSSSSSSRSTVIRLWHNGEPGGQARCQTDGQKDGRGWGEGTDGGREASNANSRLSARALVDRCSCNTAALAVTSSDAACDQVPYADHLRPFMDLVSRSSYLYIYIYIYIYI